jgi:ACS family glucarate transporter-like MFS transporter
MGLIMGSFFLLYAIFQIPTGLLVDAWGTRRGLLLFGMAGAVTLITGAMAIGFDPFLAFLILLVSRSTMGISQAGLFPASSRAIADWITLRRRALATGILTASMSVGGALGAFQTGKLLGFLHWTTVFLMYAAPGIVLSLFFYLWYRNFPEEHSGTNEAERELLHENRSTRLSSGGRSPWGAVLLRPAVLLLCGQQFFRAAANVFYLTWFATFLQQGYGQSKEAAGAMTSWPLLGVVFGSLAGGWIADQIYIRTNSKRASRSGMAIVTLVVGVALFLVAYGIQQVEWAVFVISLAAFFSSFSNPSAYTTSIDLGERNIAAVFGSMNMAGNIGSFLFPLLVPFWVDATGDWRSVLFLSAGLYLFGLLCWVFLNPDTK